MSLYERITEALNGTTPAPWEAWPNAAWRDNSEFFVGTNVALGPEGQPFTWQPVALVDSDLAEADARLIAAAPGLLAEAAQRLHTTEDVGRLVEIMRGLEEWYSKAHPSPKAGQDMATIADLLAQAFLEETP